MAWIRRHLLFLVAALGLMAVGAWLAFAEHNPGIGWMLIVWGFALVAACATPKRPTAPPGRGGSRSG
ncbi:hypothetical protein [Conexibacter arvalis]|uniref:Putative membrane protein n=1 Tax=Conexibacter arvalis TaxID=912552 RepID=A0A840ICS6_9ACTN|nr:hypothetical protein [Conexibacter arvalis]MBB4662041.1 putative membrane protein [Conexibacter arvalis]